MPRKKKGGVVGIGKDHNNRLDQFVYLVTKRSVDIITQSQAVKRSQDAESSHYFKSL